MAGIPDIAEPDLSKVAFVFMCDPCAADYFPQKPLPRVGDILVRGGWDSEMRSAAVHSSCAADFVANGFEIVDPDPDENDGLELYCAHYKWDAAADEWRKAS